MNKGPLLFTALLMFACVGCTTTPNHEEEPSPPETVQESILPIDTEAYYEEYISEAGREEEQKIQHILNLPPEELISAFPDADGAYAEAVINRLIKMLIDDINTTITLIADSDLQNDQIDLLCLLLGMDFAVRELPDETIQIIYDARNLERTAKELHILDSIIDSYERA